MGVPARWPRRPQWAEPPNLAYVERNGGRKEEGRCNKRTGSSHGPEGVAAARASTTSPSATVDGGTGYVFSLVKRDAARIRNSSRTSINGCAVVSWS